MFIIFNKKEGRGEGVGVGGSNYVDRWKKWHIEVGAPPKNLLLYQLLLRNTNVVRELHFVLMYFPGFSF